MASVFANEPDARQPVALRRTWPTVERFLLTTPPVAPAPGFVLRWQARLQAQRKRRERWQAMGLLFANVCGAGVALVLFGLLSFVQSRSFGQIFLDAAAARALEAVEFFDVVAGILGSLARALPLALPLPVWMGLLACGGAGGILWLIAFRKLAQVEGFTWWA